jgi:hypothetical protein
MCPLWRQILRLCLRLKALGSPRCTERLLALVLLFRNVAADLFAVL